MLRQCIRILMVSAFLMLNVKVIFLQLLQPPCQLTLRLLKRVQPLKATMISAQCEVLSQQNFSKVVIAVDNSFCVTEYIFSDLDIALLAKVITYSVPSL